MGCHWKYLLKGPNVHLNERKLCKISKVAHYLNFKKQIREMFSAASMIFPQSIAISHVCTRLILSLFEILKIIPVDVSPARDSPIIFHTWAWAESRYRCWSEWSEDDTALSNCYEERGKAYEGGTG